MSAAAHIFAFLFAAASGTLTYIVHTAADHPRVSMRHLAGIIFFLAIPLIAVPDIALAIILYYVAGTFLASGIQSRTGLIPTTPLGRRQGSRTATIDDRRQQTGPQTRQHRSTRSQQSTQRHPPETGPRGEPIVFQDQLRDD